MMLLMLSENNIIGGVSFWNWKQFNCNDQYHIVDDHWLAYGMSLVSRLALVTGIYIGVATNSLAYAHVDWFLIIYVRALCYTHNLYAGHSCS